MYKHIDKLISYLFLFGLSLESCCLGLSSEFLDFVFEVLLGLPVGDYLWLLQNALLDQSVLWLELPEGVFGAVDQTEGRGLVSSEFGSHSEDDHLLQGGIEFLRDEFLQVLFGADRRVGVEDVDEELGSVQQLVLSEFLCGNGDSLCHLYGLYFLVFLRL